MDPKPPLIFGLPYDIPSSKMVVYLALIPVPKELRAEVIHFLRTSLGIAKKDIMYIGRLLSTELITVSLPPIERCFPFQLASLFSTRFSTIFQSKLLYFLKCIGRTRYFRGKSLCLHPNYSK
jgi:hypothetical protein